MNYQNKNSKNYFRNPECYFIQDYLYSYLKNSLNDLEKKNLENHLKNCPSCSFEYENLIEFKNEIQKSLSNKDIQSLFKGTQDKRNKLRQRFFEKFLTLIFSIFLATSIAILLLNFISFTN